MRSVRPCGKYRSIRHTKISEIQTGIFGRMERAPYFSTNAIVAFLTHRHNSEIQIALVSKRKTLLSWKVVNRYKISISYAY